MSQDVYADGVGEITVTGPIVRIDLVSLSATERDAGGNPKAVFRQRIIMPIDGFAGAVDLMRQAMEGMRASAARPPAPPQTAAGATAPTNIRSPNFA